MAAHEQLRASIGLLIYCVVSGSQWPVVFVACASSVETQTYSFYRELFPQERRVVSPKKQMQAHLRGRASDAVSPLPLLAKTALGLRNNTMQLDELRYSQQRNDLQLQLRTPTMRSARPDQTAARRRRFERGDQFSGTARQRNAELAST